MSPDDFTREVQSRLGVTPDGKPGAITLAALDQRLPSVTTPDVPEVHHVKASSFADPADIAAFRECKAEGHSDDVCFGRGDNGIGCWGDDTTIDKPMCALPPEDWNHLGPAARGARVLVKANGHSVICELRDTMPHRLKIKNGAGIDLTPAAVKSLGLNPPIMVDATWQWA